MLINYLQYLTLIKSDLVVVGSTALFVRGLTEKEPNDIDINVSNLDFLEGHDLIEYASNSTFSVSGKRAFLRVNVIPKNLDIFVEREQPEFEIINGVRVVSANAAREYYKTLLPIVPEFFKESVLKYLNIYEYE